MENSQDIIGIVRKLQEKHRKPSGQWVIFNEDKEAILNNFPAIASHILDQEARLKRAEAGYAETLEAFGSVAGALDDMGQGVVFDFEKHKQNLASLRSTPTT